MLDQYTDIYIQLTSIESEQEAMELSYKKWNWLANESRSVLMGLRVDREVTVGGNSCPMCIFRAPADTPSACRECPYSVMHICKNTWHIAMAALNDAGSPHRIQADRGWEQFTASAKIIANEMREILEQHYPDSEVLTC